MKSEEITSTTDTKKQARTPATKSQKFNWLKSLCRDKTMSSTAKVVAFVLADHHNDETGRCNPSQRRIADSAGLGIRAISRAITDLKAGGWITATGTYWASDYVLEVDHHGAEGEAEGMSDLRRTGRTPYDANDVPPTTRSTDPLRQGRRTNLRREPRKETTKLNLTPAEKGGPSDIEQPVRVQIAPEELAELSEAGLAWLVSSGVELISSEEIEQPVEVQTMPYTKLDAIASTFANDDRPESSEVVRIRGLTIPGATLREWEATYRYLDVRAQLADLAKWTCEKTPEEGSRLRLLASMLLKKNKAAHGDFMARRADTEAKASAPPLVATSRFQLLIDADGNTVSGGAASAVPFVRAKDRFAIY